MGRRIGAGPSDPAAHGRNLRQRLDAAEAAADTWCRRFQDERRLFRFTVNKGFDPDLLLKISKEVEFVSQEGDNLVVAFVNSAASDII
ncbi:MAG: hypothetical protein U5J62_02795 [Desulfurivibrio sp.]|nr:hypothetical protein [Desulfurivibrio sp.]